ncbi:hypothetical protein [Nocardia fusca]|uniref:hypothetical protein n=1 Tax=Nocardia fusca TaxID=941183 RepID=UPI000AF07D50|nr:hypothetical protein [Nocardia fusca]
MKIVNDHLAVKARLTTPTENGFLLLAAETGRWAGPFPLPARSRGRVLAQARPLCARLARRDDVLEVTPFRATLRPPGEGGRLLRLAGRSRHQRARPAPSSELCSDAVEPAEPHIPASTAAPRGYGNSRRFRFRSGVRRRR